MAPAHPLARLTADEFTAARDLLTGLGHVTDKVRFAFLGLEEPPKSEVLAFRAGDPVDRRVRAILLDTATGATTVVVASLTRSTVDSARTVDTGVEGQAPIMLEEFEAVDRIVKADERWLAAMARRGITDPELVRACPLSAGDFGIDGEPGCRLLRVLSFLAEHPPTTAGPTRSTAWWPTSISSAVRSPS